MTRLLRSSILIFSAALLLATSLDSRAGIWNDDRYSFDLRSYDSSFNFLLPTSYFLLSNSPFRIPNSAFRLSTSLYDRDGDRTDSVYHPADVGSLANPYTVNPFNVSLFNNVSTFVGGGTTSKTSSPLVLDVATTYTYNRTAANTSGTADQWSAGTNWSAVPVGASDTTLTFGTGPLISTATIFTNNDIAGDFKLNILNFTYAGPASGTPPTVTVSGNRLEFISNGATTPTLNLNATGTIRPTLTISNDILLTNNLSITGVSTNTTLSGTISGSSTITNTSTGITTLSGANTYTGGTTQSAGTLALGSSSAVSGGVIISGPVGTGTLSLSGSTLRAATAQTLQNNLSLSGTVTFGANSNTGTITFNSTGLTTPNTVALTADTAFSVFSGTTLNLANAVSGAFKLTKSASGTLTLSVANSYSGGTALTGGTIAIGDDAALGSGTFTFSTGTTLQSADANARTIANVWALGTTQTFGSAGTGDLTLSNTGSISLGSTAKTFTINNNNTTLAATFTSTGGITKNGSGRLFLTGTSTYTATGAPTTIDAGTLNAAIIANGGTASSIGQASNLATRLVFGGGSLQYTGSTAASTDRLFTIGDANGDTATLDASGTSVGTLSFTNGGAIAFGTTNAHTLTLTGTNTGNNTFSPVINDNTGATSVTKSGGGTWVVSGLNGYTGGTTISDGLLRANSSTALGSTSGTLNVNGTGVLDLNGQNIGVGNLTGTSNAKIWNNGVSNAVTFTIGNGNNGGGTYAGLIADNNGASAGTVALTKTGNATITLTGANTYSGATQVNGGTLLVTNTTGSATGTSNITVNNSGTLGGTGTVSGAVDVKSGGTLSPGTSPGTLTTGAVTLENGSTFLVDLTASSGNDVLVAPSVTLGSLVTGPSLSLNITGSLTTGQQFFIVNNTGASAVSGVFAQGATITSGQYVFSIDYLADFGSQSAVGGNDIMLQVTAIPETSTWIGAALALGAIGATQRGRVAKMLKS